jgi:hypothetical protein
VQRPRSYEPLAGFSCGPGEEAWETHVNRVAERLVSGEAVPQTLVVLEDAAGGLVGICTFWPRDLLLPLHRTPLLEVPYINTIATDARYRGARLADGGRPGDVLLEGALSVIRTMNGGSLPWVYALVAADNARAHSLFERHGFGEVGALTPGGQSIRIHAPE